MALRSGLGSQIGWATEETVGTYKAPSAFGLYESETLDLTKQYIESHGLAAGRLSQRQNLHIATTRAVAGDFTLELLESGFGKLFNLLNGAANTPVKTETKTYTAKFEVGLTDPYGKALTIQVGRPDTSGVVRAFSYVGCKIVGMSIAVAAGGTMVLTVTVDGIDEKTGEALATASYSATALPFSFEGMTCKIGGSTVAYVKSMTINITIPQATDRYLIGSAGLKAEPIINDLVAVTADAEMEFASLASHERFTKAEVVELQLLGKGQKIEASNFCAANFTMPAAKQISDSEPVSGPDLLTESVSFMALDNGVKAPLTIETVSEDSAL